MYTHRHNYKHFQSTFFKCMEFSHQFGTARLRYEILLRYGIRLTVGRGNRLRYGTQLRYGSRLMVRYGTVAIRNLVVVQNTANGLVWNGYGTEFD